MLILSQLTSSNNNTIMACRDIDPDDTRFFSAPESHNAAPPFPSPFERPLSRSRFPSPDDFGFGFADRGGRRGGGRHTRSPHRHNHLESNSQTKDDDASPDTAREGKDFSDPAEFTPSESDDDGFPPFFYSSEGPFGRRGVRVWGPPHGRGGRRDGRFRRGPGGSVGRSSPRPAFNVPDMTRRFLDESVIRNLRQRTDRHNRPADGTATRQQPADNDAFTPPIDIFNTPTAFVLHAALPGANKSDIDVTWNSQRRTLRIAGVAHRPGDEAFLQTLTSVQERTIGFFEREVPLPPAGVANGDQDVEVDGSRMTAKMEQGLLIVTVPKVGKEWKEEWSVVVE